MFFFVFSSVVVVVLLAGILLLSDSCRTRAHDPTTRPARLFRDTTVRRRWDARWDSLLERKKQMRCRFVNHLRVLFSPIKTMHATLTTNNALSSLSLFSQNTLYSSIEGTENNREEVSLFCARWCVRSKLCSERWEVRLALQMMKTRATFRKVGRSFSLWGNLKRKERKEKRKGNREKFCFFSLFCLFLGKGEIFFWGVHSPKNIITRFDETFAQYEQLSLSLYSKEHLSVIFSSSQRVIIVLLLVLLFI